MHNFALTHTVADFTSYRSQIFQNWNLNSQTSNNFDILMVVSKPTFQYVLLSYVPHCFHKNQFKIHLEDKLQFQIQLYDISWKKPSLTFNTFLAFKNISNQTKLIKTYATGIKKVKIVGCLTVQVSVLENLTSKKVNSATFAPKKEFLFIFWCKWKL